MRDLDNMDLTWIVRRMPDDVRSLLVNQGNEMFLAGGFIRACIANETVNDVDLFTGSKEAAKAWSQFIAEKRKKQVFKTDNAITVPGKPPVQFIHRWTFDTPRDCIASFDFTIAQAAVWWEPVGNPKEGRDGRWNSICSDRFYADLAARRLVYTSPRRSEEAGGSLLRVLKFYQRGYRIDLDSLGKVVARLSMGDGLVRAAVTEESHAKVCSGLLREVDPDIDPSHNAHLPSPKGEETCDA